MPRSGAIPFLLVERYDRSVDNDGVITRLPQEDFCQALSISPELKYVEEGGPDAERSVAHRQSYSAAAGDRLSFIWMLIFQYLVGNADAHGKNYALLYRATTPDLAPIYDVVCTAVYPRLAKRMAMAIDGRSISDTFSCRIG